MTDTQKETIRNNIETIKANVSDALKKSEYSQEVSILLATKTRTPEEINFALQCGISYIGENRVQELLKKYDSINNEGIHIHFIGHLQKNKVKYIIDKVDMIESVDSISLAEEIDRCAKKIGKTMDVLCEINIGHEESKSGVFLENAEEFINEIKKFTNLRICGFMAIPPKMTSSVTQKQFFQKIMNFYIDISQKKLDNVYCRYLSMGMSDDYPIAIECGSNIVRIGTAAFGERKNT